MLFAACGTTTLRNDFGGYSKAYAELQNQQMLLNLARLDNGHPAYFLAMGEIRSDYEYLASGGATGGGTQNSGLGTLGDAVTRTVTGNATGLVSRKETPKFQYIPMNSEQTARQLLEPMAPDVFYTLFQQGWPADQLLRVLVERVEVSLKNGTTLVLTNSPSRADASSFARFLRLSEMLRNFQKCGALTINNSRNFSPTGDPITVAPSPKETMDAAEKQMKWKQLADGKWQLGRDKESSIFTLVLGNSRVALQKYDGSASDDKKAAQQFAEVFAQGVTIKGRHSESDLPGTARLILRSYSKMLESVAVEQNTFPEFLEKSDATIVPASQRRPVLQTRWNSVMNLRSPLQSVSYAGRTYVVGDPPPAKSGANFSPTWNRDIFRLLTQLASLVSVDISKFRRQVLEIE